MADNVVAIAPSSSRTLPHLSRYPLAHIVEKLPTRLHQRQFTFQLVTRHALLVDARKRERDAPKISSAYSWILLDYVEFLDSRKLCIHFS